VVVVFVREKKSFLHEREVGGGIWFYFILFSVMFLFLKKKKLTGCLTEQ
jgi:hypothetical protein